MSENTPHSKLLTRGGQIVFNNLRMFFQINRQIACGFFLFTGLFVVLIVWLTTTHEIIQGTYDYLAAWLFSKVGLSNHVFNFLWRGENIRVDTVGVLSERYFINQVALFYGHLKGSLFIGFCVSFVVMMGFSGWLIRKGKKQSQKRSLFSFIFV